MSDDSYDPHGDLELIASVATDLRTYPAHVLADLAEDIAELAEHIAAVDDHVPADAQREVAA